MGATNNIKGTNISLQLADKECSNCSQKFTEQEIDDRNFDIWFDTTNDVKLTSMEELEKDLREDPYYTPFGRTGYELTIWIRSIDHEHCPPMKRCSYLRCWEKKLEKDMKYIEWDEKTKKGDECFCNDECYQHWLISEQERDNYWKRYKKNPKQTN